jgi:hypothetical protein
VPEPLLYFEAMLAAAAVSAAVVLAASFWRPPPHSARLISACLLGIAAAVGLGCWILRLLPAWPPANALDRFLTIVFPAVICAEVIAALKPLSPRAAWLLRIGVAAASGRILLHGSVYLPGPRSEWTAWQAAAALVICGVLFAAVWALLSWLWARAPGVSIPLSLAIAIQSAGTAVMLAGYIKGGAAAIPLSATLAGAAIASTFAKHPDRQTLFGPGVAGLFGIVFIGRFFGNLSTTAALILFLAPLLCWATEAPLLRSRKPWIVESLRLFLVAIPLAAVLFAAKRDFDRDLAPLLGGIEEAPSRPAARESRELH